MNLRQLKHAPVRDLAWVMQSPALLEGSPDNGVSGCQARVITDAFCQSVYRTNQRWLAEQDNDPGPLRQWLAERQSHRLGYYFEALVEYWLRHLLGDGDLHTRVAVRQVKRTLGEFDFLFVEKQARLLNHWEVAVKFYLRHRCDDGGYVWFGPGARDRFDKKVKHLIDHQCHLSETVPGQAAIRAQFPGIAALPVQSQILLKGYLFYPANSDWRHPDEIPAAASPRHLTGWWTHCNELLIPEDSSQSRWCPVTKLRWLAPVVIGPKAGEGELSEADLLSRQQLVALCRAHFLSRAEPVLIAELQPGNNGSWSEISRGFVVGEHWPNKA